MFNVKLIPLVLTKPDIIVWFFCIGTQGGMSDYRAKQGIYLIL